METPYEMIAWSNGRSRLLIRTVESTKNVVLIKQKRHWLRFWLWENLYHVPLTNFNSELAYTQMKVVQAVEESNKALLPKTLW